MLCLKLVIGLLVLAVLATEYDIVHFRLLINVVSDRNQPEVLED